MMLAWHPLDLDDLASGLTILANAKDTT